MLYKTVYVVDSGFVVGPHPASTNEGLDVSLRRILQEHQIAVIIDLTCPADGLQQPMTELSAALPGVQVYSFPIPDMGVPSQPLMLAILDTIDAARAQRRNIYLHCAAGIGRSGMTIACWFIRLGDSSAESLVRLANVRGDLHTQWPAPESAVQRNYVRAWMEPTTTSAARMRGFRDRFRGALLGLAVGDCLGVPLEFTQPGERTVNGMVGGGPFGLAVGEWTDDTSMALCLADSIVTCGTFDANDQMQRYVRWHNEGLWSSQNRCFDIGNTVSEALARYRQSGLPYAGRTDSQSAGNGSLMRLAPIPMAYGYDAQLCAERAAQSSQTTHGAPTAVEACQFYAAMMAEALHGVSRDVFLQAALREWHTPEIREIAEGSFRTKHPPQIVGSGYVVKSLEAALWAFAGNDSFGSATLAAVNLAHDSDTTGAICGMLAGGYWGESAIPAEWLAVIVRRRDIEWLAEELLRQSWPEWQRTL